MRRGRLAGVLLCGLLPAAAGAHSFGRLYTLPVPLWLYAWGAGAALVASFLVAGYFLGVRAAAPAPAPRGRTVSPLLIAVLRAAALLGLLLCVLTGLAGTSNPYANLGMTLFWVVFVLGLPYLTALLGNVYALVQPWATLAAALDRVQPQFSRGRLRYPPRLAWWPALALYMAFIWIELFGHTRPASLPEILLAYSALTLFAVWLFGARDWFAQGEFFGVMLQLLGRIAPLDLAAPGERQPARVARRAPCSGLLEPAPHASLLLFVLFMLSSTAYDGLRDTAVWVNFVWGTLFENLKPWLGDNPVQAYATLRPLYLAVQTATLLLSPLLYLALYLLCLALAKGLTRSPLDLRTLALHFTYSLLPIALVYHLSHYYTLLLTQGVKIVPLLSDPFGFGWNLFGTAGWLRAPILPDALVVWHTQVALIVAGHVVSVVVAHRQALRLFPTRRQALLSQLPMLALMLAFTTAGLWILSQPLKPGG